MHSEVPLLELGLETTGVVVLHSTLLLIDWGVEWAGTVLYCTVLHGAVPCCAVQYGMVGGAGVHV